MPKRGQPGYREWLPPQRNPGETARHYTAELNKTIRHLTRMIEDSHNSERQKERWRKRVEVCEDAIQKVTMENIR